MREKMIPAFAQAQGGLFAAVEKADVGNAYQEMERQGIALMGWADPFMPDFSMPEAVEQAVSAALEDGVRTSDIAAPGQAAVGCAAMGQAIARRLWLKESTVSTRIQRGRKLLLAAMEQEGYCYD